MLKHLAYAVAAAVGCELTIARWIPEAPSWLGWCVILFTFAAVWVAERASHAWYRVKITFSSRRAGLKLSITAENRLQPPEALLD
jgi:hypothetical protein